MIFCQKKLIHICEETFKHKFLDLWTFDDVAKNLCIGGHINNKRIVYVQLHYNYNDK